MVYRKRPDILADKRSLIEGMRACRDAAIQASSQLRPSCETYAEIHMLTAAIDRLAEHLTGDPRLFHAGGTAPSRLVNGIGAKREG